MPNRAIPIFPPLTGNERVVFDTLASASPGDFTAAMLAEVTAVDEARVERALRSLECRNPPLAVATSLACLHWRLAHEHVVASPAGPATARAF
jgi:hypothetical protein